MPREQAGRYKGAGAIETAFKRATSSEFRAGYREFKFQGQLRTAIDRFASENSARIDGPKNRHFNRTVIVRGNRYSIHGESVDRAAAYTRMITMELNGNSYSISLNDRHDEGNTVDVSYQNRRNSVFVPLPSSELVAAAHDLMPTVDFSLILPRRRKAVKAAA